MKKKYRCFALFSGGLDSMLSVLHMKKLGFDVLPIFFKTPFFGSENAQKAAEEIGYHLIIHDITDNHINMLLNPRYGYGKHLNPCIDCHGLMFREAAELMSQYKVDFLISGEVLGQRPMSQRKDALNSVGKLSNVKDKIIRPLSQKLLADTFPIREEWVDKEKMLYIQERIDSCYKLYYLLQKLLPYTLFDPDFVSVHNRVQDKYRNYQNTFHWLH